jgi:hypothetical protein
MITPQEVKSWLAQGDCARFKDKTTHLLWDAVMTDEDEITLKLVSPSVDYYKCLTIVEFVDEFEESYTG